MYLDEAIFEVLTEDLEEKVEPKTEMKGRTRKFYTFVFLKSRLFQTSRLLKNWKNSKGHAYYNHTLIRDYRVAKYGK